VERYLICHGAHETPVGLVQVLVRSIPLIGGVARVNRGPVFFDEAHVPVPSPESVKEVFRAIRNVARRRRWWLLRIAPELPPDRAFHSALRESGYAKRDTPGAASAVLDISRTPEDIRAGFHGKWRNLLKKSEKMGLDLEVPPLAEAFPFLLEQYETMQQEKSFEGVASSLLRAMVGRAGPAWTCQVLFAVHEGQRHGAVMTVGHGDTCTYLIGWTSDEGRRLQANYFLLWHCMLEMRRSGYRYFDVGGLGAHTTSGVEHFKKRLKGDEYSLIGEYSCSPIPLLR
jgi:hypothetical protein